MQIMRMIMQIRLVINQLMNQLITIKTNKNIGKADKIRNNTIKSTKTVAKQNNKTYYITKVDK